jgi:CheY-like chemotaxis protein
MGTILIVEDDDAIAQLYKIVLSKRHHSAEIAVDGEEGVQKAKALKPSLILLDIMMPKKNGMQVIEELKADPDMQRIPVFALSNLAEAAAEQKMLQSGALKFLIKSQYLPDQIVDIIEEFLATTQSS